MKENVIGSNVAVVGGGLAGLTAANFLARAGFSVTLFEKSHDIGGRARTEAEQGFHFNLGPHALYAGGAAIRILRKLRVNIRGKSPATSSGFAIDRGAKHTLPVGPFSMLTTGLLGLGAKLEAARLLGSISKFDARGIERLSLREWAEREVRHPDARRLFQAFIRVATYSNDPERQSAGAAIAQLQLALASGVLYLDGGWQTLVQGLRDKAEKEGVKIVVGERVKAVERDGRVRGLRLADESFYAAPVVVIAAGPDDAYELVDRSEGTVLSEWARAAIPVRTDEPWRPWLTRVAMNLSRDLLRRRRRRHYEGPWLPSPIETGDEASPPSYEPVDEQGNPAARYDILESVSFAFLLALEALTPAQRAVLLLRDVFDYSVLDAFGDIKRIFNVLATRKLTAVR